MQAARLQLFNIMGVSEAVIDFGKVTVVKGANGSGKTSRIEALKKLLKGGHDATLLRAGQKEGEIVLVLQDDNGQPITIRERITPEGTTPDVRDANNKQIPGGPRSFVRKMFDEIAFNPIEFIQATPQEQARILLEQLDMRLTPEQIAKTGIESYSREVLEWNAFDALDALHEATYDARTGFGGKREEAKRTIDNLSQTLPPEQLDIEDVLASRRAKLQEQETALGKLHSEVKRILDEQNREAENEYADAAREIDEKIAALQAAKQDAMTAKVAKINENRQQANDLFNRYKDQHSGQITTLTADIAALEEAHKAQIRAQQTRDLIEENRARFADLSEKWDRLASQLKALELLKHEILEALPIPGVEVRGGVIYQDFGDGPVPFQRWNEAAKWLLALRIAKMRKGALGLVIIDGINFLDRSTYDAFMQAAEVTPGLQFFVTEVSDDPEVVVETVGEKPAETLFNMAPEAGNPYTQEGGRRRGRR